METWNSVDKFEHYQVSDFGRVRSLTKVCGSKNGGTQCKTGKILKPGDSGGKLLVVLYRDGQPHTETVHSLVMHAFVGPRPDGLLIRHLNGDHTDNRPSNLSYGTQAENMADALDHGRVLIGSDAPNAAFTDAQVRSIREHPKYRSSFRELADAYGVDYKTIYNVVRRYTYKNVA